MFSPCLIGFPRCFLGEKRSQEVIMGVGSNNHKFQIFKKTFEKLKTSTSDHQIPQRLCFQAFSYVPSSLHHSPVYKSHCGIVVRVLDSNFWRAMQPYDQDVDLSWSGLPHKDVVRVQWRRGADWTKGDTLMEIMLMTLISHMCKSLSSPNPN